MTVESVKTLTYERSSPRRFEEANLSREQLLCDVIGSGIYSKIYNIKRIFQTDSVLKLNTKDVTSPGFENIKELDILIKTRGHPYFVQIVGIIYFEKTESTDSDYEIEDNIHFALKKETSSIRELLIENRPSDFVKYSYQLAVAINFLHENSVVHGDLKPDNILYCEQEDKILLADFGISVYDDHLFYQSIKTLYSNNYKPPEVRNTTKVDCSLDVYTYGIIVYEFMTKKFACKHYEFEECGPLESLVKNCMKRNPVERVRMIDCINHPAFKDFRRRETFTTIRKTVFLNHNFSTDEQKIILSFYERKNIEWRTKYHSLAVVIHMMCILPHLDILELLETTTCMFIKTFASLDNYFTNIKTVNRKYFSRELEIQILEEFSSKGIVFDCLYSLFELEKTDLHLLETIFEKQISLKSDCVYTDLHNLYHLLLS